MTWANFTRDEFRCRCGNCENKIADSFIDKLQDLREALGFPLKITSGYRCPAHNAKVSGTGRNGPHTTGHAADISVSREQAFKLVSMAAISGFTGIGVAQKGASRYIHLDDLSGTGGQPRPTIWSY